jgi:hypothetical protein
MTTPVEEMLEFLEIVGSKGFLNPNTVGARATACRKFIDILEPEQRNVEYLTDNLDVVKGRFMHLNKDVAGATVDEYARRVKLVVDDFVAWKADRAGWEKKNAAKQASRPASDGEKKAKPKADKTETASTSKPDISATIDPSMRTVEVPLRKGVEAKLTIPREDFTMADAMKIAWAMVAYTSDFDPEVSPRNPFPMLGKGSDYRDAQ